MAYQSKNASQEGRRNMLAALHVDSGSLTQLGHEITEQVTPLKHHNLAYGRGMEGLCAGAEHRTSPSPTFTWLTQ